MTEWKSAKENQPETKGRYAVLYQFANEDKLRKWVADYDPIAERWFGQLADLDIDVEIKYWVQLPEIPE